MGRVKEAMLDLASELENKLNASDTGRAWFAYYSEWLDETDGSCSPTSATADYISDSDVFDTLCRLVPGLEARASQWFDLVVYALVTLYEWQF